MTKEIFTQKVLEAETTLYRIAKTILIRESDCEDAVQEAILLAYEKRNTLKEEKYFKTWLVRILMNECYKIQRKKNKVVSYEDYVDTEKPQPESDYSELYEALQNLPEKIRITIVIYYIEGYSVEEVKDLLRIPAGTVKSRLAKGRKLLKEQLDCKEVHYETV